MDLENTSRRYNICVSGITEGIENESNLETIIEEIIEKHFPERNKDLNLQREFTGPHLNIPLKVKVQGT